MIDPHDCQYDDRVQRCSGLLRVKPHVGYPVNRIMGILGSRPELIEPKYILDVGCGFGRLSLALSSHFPHCQVVGVDRDLSCVEYAQSEARALQIADRCHFVVADAQRQVEMLGSGLYDLVAFLAVHGIFSDDELALAAAKLLKSGGVAIVDAAVLQTSQHAALRRLNNIEDKLRAAGGEVLCFEQVEHPYVRDNAVRTLLARLDRSEEISINSRLPRSVVEQRLNEILATLHSSPTTSKIICKVWIIRF